MVTIMDLEPTNAICDGRPNLVQSAISQRAVDLEIMSTAASTTTMARQIDAELSKKVLKLELKHPRAAEKGSIDEADEKCFGLKSPKSPMSTSSEFFFHMGKIK